MREGPSRCEGAASIVVRDARSEDVEALLVMMRELAVFEGYVDQFRVSASDLIERGFAAPDKRQFHALVATSGEDLLGYAVVYQVPFTFDLRPTLVLKELYVRSESRGKNVGGAIMSEVLAHARERGCGRVKWDVLPGNDAAKRFYRRLDAERDAGWENWILAL